MGGQAGGMRNEAGHWPEVCKKSLQAMVADMQQGLRPEFFSRYSHRPAADAVAARAGMVRPAHHAALTPGPATRITASSPGTRRLDRVADKLRDHAARRDLLLRQRPLVQRGRLSAAALRPAVRHQLRQQLLLLLPSGQRRRPRPLARHRHGHRHARGRREHRPVLPDRRQPGVEPSAPDAHADEHSPARRPGHRHQSRSRNSAWSTSACRPTCGACCSARRSPASTCSRTSAATSPC